MKKSDQLNFEFIWQIYCDGWNFRVFFQGQILKNEGAIVDIVIFILKNLINFSYVV